MTETGIEWTDEVWNPVVGCSKVSAGCRHCYAETVHRNKLSSRHGYPEFRPWSKRNAAHNVTQMPHRLDQPLRWRKPRMIFVNSMSDLFHELLPVEYIAQVFAVMAHAPEHTFQVLTKRPERMAAIVGAPDFRGRIIEAGENTATIPDRYYKGAVAWPLPNVWLGTSIENDKWLGRADALRETPAAVRFISAEPLLGPLVNSPFGSEWPHRSGPELDLWNIDWLICGGESGPGHRPMELAWAHDLRRAAAAAGTAFFMKQMGGHRPGGKLEDLPLPLRVREMPADKSVILTAT